MTINRGKRIELQYAIVVLELIAYFLFFIFFVHLLPHMWQVWWIFALLQLREEFIALLTP